MLSITQTALESLAALLLERVGLKIAPDGFHGLKLALTARMPALGISDSDDYVQRLRQLAGEHELRSLLPLVTVGKTEFFRDPRQFNALEKRILPDLVLTSRREGRKAMIWSAGCATGEEPYSLAVVLAEYGAKPAEVDLLATDLNPAAIESAKLGRYPARRLVGVPEQRLHRFFSRVEDGYEVIPTLRELIRFEGQNLAAPVFARIATGSLDLILCRNVIIYFDLPTIRGLMDRFLAALRPGGLLLLGYSESLFKVYDRFEMVEVEGAFVYRHPIAAPAKRVELPRRGTPVQIQIQRAAPAAIPAKSVPARPPPPSPRRTGEFHAVVPPRARTPSERLNEVVREMERGDFDTALRLIRKLVEDEPNDLDALLTLGNIYSLSGRNAESLEVFAQTVAREPFCVEARVFGGVAYLQAGKLNEAKAELTKTLFLEPALSIAHYLLAQVLEKSGDHDGARRSYRNAIAQVRFPQHPLAGHYPDMPESSEAIARAARYALAALEETDSARQP